MLVTFCGHSRVSNTAAVADALKTAVEELISEGADEFYLGGYHALRCSIPYSNYLRCTPAQSAPRHSGDDRCGKLFRRFRSNRNSRR